MAAELLSYAALADRLKTSPEGARALARRLRLPRSRSNDGRTLISVDLAEINHTPLPARSPGGHQAVTATLKAKIETLQAALARVETTAAGHRADFERERERTEHLLTELLKATLDTMAAKESVARLEGELAALRSRPWWRRLPSLLPARGGHQAVTWPSSSASATAPSTVGRAVASKVDQIKAGARDSQEQRSVECARAAVRALEAAAAATAAARRVGAEGEVPRQPNSRNCHGAG
jgi:hypothetical protein